MSTHDEPIPESEPAIDLDRRRRTRRLALFAGAGLVAVGVGLFFVVRSMEAKSQQRIDQAWDQLSRCMVGDAPLAAGETAPLRFRNIQLAAMTLPADKRAEAGGLPWPARCAPAAHGLSEALREAGRASKDGKDLSASAEELAKLLKSIDADPVIADLSSPVQSVWTLATDAGLTAHPGAAGPAPMAPAQPMTLASLRPDDAITRSFFGFKNLFDEANPAEAIRFVVEDKSVPESPFVCTVTAASAACRKLPAPLAAANGLRLLGTSDDGVEPLVFAGNRGSDGVFRSDTGAMIEKMYSYSGQVTRDGAAAILGWDEGTRELRLLRQQPGKAVQTHRVKLDLRIGNFFYSTATLWDQLLVRGVSKEGAIRLLARPVDMSGGEPFGPEQDVGPLGQRGPAGEGTPHITGCRTSEAIVAKVEGHTDEFLTFKTSTGFSPPVVAPGRGGILSCRGAEATLTQVTRSSIIQVRCTPAGCSEKVVEAAEVFGKDKELAVREGFLAGADVDGKLLVIWGAGERGGLRMRLAPAEQLARATDTVLFDDLVQDQKLQKLSTLVEMKLLSRGKLALLLLSTPSGVHAVRIDASGKPSPVVAKWAK